jgi:sensor c-di-GMP phosphodiesterase-like protein
VLRATVVERGRFQVMLSDTPVKDMFDRYADSVSVGGAHQRRVVYKSKHGSDQVVPADTAPVTFNWSTGNILVTTTLPGISPISVQTIVSAANVWENSHWVLLGMLCLSMLTGQLVANGITRKCRHVQSMDFRIQHLCQPANVVCHYQPMLELATGRVVGCEVLGRLQDGDKLIYPDQFIPALTKQGLSCKFDTAVSRQALLALSDASLGSAQNGFTVALNFFPQNLKRDKLHAHLQSSLQHAKHRDLHIELEVTEYDFSPEIVPELSKLKADGYFISIDDFGTGYSNLAMVKRVAPDYLKIDKSFVFEMEDLTIRSSLIPEIIAIARAVGSKVIAEGIETAAQAEQLRALGVEYGQGYYFARPMPLADFLSFLHKSNAG